MAIGGIAGIGGITGIGTIAGIAAIGGIAGSGGMAGMGGMCTGPMTIGSPNGRPTGIGGMRTGIAGGGLITGMGAPTGAGGVGVCPSMLSGSSGLAGATTAIGREALCASCAAAGAAASPMPNRIKNVFFMCTFLCRSRAPSGIPLALR